MSAYRKIAKVLSSTLVNLVLVGALVSVSTECKSEITNLEYVQQCQAAGVDIPGTLSCQAGTEITLTASTCNDEGEILSQEVLTPRGFRSDPKQCDHPSLVQRLSPIAGCIPGDRFVWKKLSNGTLCAMVCRRTMLLGALDEFTDISLICHQPKNGATCFFNSNVDVIFGKGYRGDQILPPGHPKQTVWKEPEGLNESRCIDCHDKSPFLITPNLKQLKGTIYKDYQPGGKYWVVGDKKPFAAAVWKNRYVLDEPNACTTCHDIGSGIHGGCGHLRDVATGRSSYLSPTQCGFEKGFMPPKHFGNVGEFEKDIQRIEQCCRDFNDEGLLKPEGLCRWKKLESFL